MEPIPALEPIPVVVPIPVVDPDPPIPIPILFEVIPIPIPIPVKNGIITSLVLVFFRGRVSFLPTARNTKRLAPSPRDSSPSTG